MGGLRKIVAFLINAGVKRSSWGACHKSSNEDWSKRPKNVSWYFSHEKKIFDFKTVVKASDEAPTALTDLEMKFYLVRD